jgi:hypothetical protein
MPRTLEIVNESNKGLGQLQTLIRNERATRTQIRLHQKGAIICFVIVALSQSTPIPKFLCICLS